MKKLLIALALITLPASAIAAFTPVGWSGDSSAQILQPLKTFWDANVKASYFTATSTTATSTFAGNVGVGTTTPAAKFAIHTDQFTITIGDVVSGSATQTNDISYSLTAAGNYYEWYVYAYKTVGSVTAYSANPYTITASDDGLGAQFRWDVSWGAVSGATGYVFVVVSDDFYSLYGNAYKTTASTNTTYNNPYSDGTIFAAPTVTPSSPYAEYAPALYAEGTAIVQGELKVVDTGGTVFDTHGQGWQPGAVGEAVTLNKPIAITLSNNDPGVQLLGVDSADMLFIRRTSGAYGTLSFSTGDFDAATRNFYISNYNDGSFRIASDANPYIVLRSNNVGISNQLPSAKLDVLGATEQLRLGYNTSNYWSNTIGSTGALAMQGVGTGGAITITPTAGQSANINLSTTGDFTVNTSHLVVDTSSNFVGISTTTPSALLSVGSVSTATTTINFSSAAAKGTCLMMKDVDGTGVTYITANNGVLTATTTSCQ